MPRTSQSAEFQQLLARLESVARDVAASQATDVDTRSRFPQETLDALKEAGLLAAPIPRDLGGAGCGVVELAELCSTLARACGSSAMVLAMHYVQVACVVRHAGDSERFQSYLRELAERQYLLGSMTSENGTFGEMRTSICAVRHENGRFALEKDATTGSYCAQADAILVTARRTPDAAGTDQVLVWVNRGDRRLTQTGTWDAMGMRGTCSPGFRLEAQGPEEQIIPASFADIAAQTMVPYSHVLWSSLWWGIAADAVARAAELVRGNARRSPGTVPPNAVPLAQVSSELQAMRHNWLAIAADLDELEARGAAGRKQLNSIGWSLKLNHLKIGASEAAPRIVHQSLQVIGILGYKNDTPFSVGRHYRDVLSASLMVSNARIASKNASMLLVYKET
ncbi:MAG TPA: acyl-CoA dehydrogenase family protein [Steroidobacteraceae bacterium]|nr:acyl-CoA dehydrogenase family protein [Steroidobacteraceae bacterium]